MKVCFEQFLGKNHSWSIVGQNLARALLKKKHDVHLRSTNGYEHFPPDLLPYVKENLDKDYDMQVSYTAMINFPNYLSHGNKNRFGIWNYETPILPTSFAKYYKATDKFLPSSQFSKQIFLENKVPEDHMVVVPHGIDLEQFTNTKEKFPLKTKKKYKILTNIAQPHIRKNIPGLLSAFGQAFTKNDDVCLVAKVVIKNKPESQFEVSFTDIFNEFKKAYPNHAEVEIVNTFIPNIAELYNACDIVFSMTHAECFWLPGIEAFAANKVVVVSNYGGQLDFMNPDNSILIDGKIERAPRKMQYWTPSPYAGTFNPNIDLAAEKLQEAVKNYDVLLQKFSPSMKATVSRLTWDNAVDQMIGLCK
ncbi:MAG TPA: glycosyltransferase [Anaerovoracaceae bacterium]|nr:glycosyltransferase [Anaerovoracaceae bacterium]